MRNPGFVVIGLLVLGCGGRPGSTGESEGDVEPVGADGGVKVGANPNNGGSCPGFERPPVPGAIACFNQGECPSDNGGTLSCITTNHPYPRFCGGAAPPPDECLKDSDCGPGAICKLPESCGRSVCAKACTDELCGKSARCTDGRCVLKRCDEPDAIPCAEGWTCRPGPATATTLGCVPVSCRDGYRCPVPLDCNPALSGDVHGCAQRKCKRASDCSCGSCVDGFCDVTPGNCSRISAPP
jgi:hypothetical protein